MTQSTPRRTDEVRDWSEDMEMTYQAEIDQLKRQVAERDAHIGVVQEEYMRSCGRAAESERQLITWREKYDRLYESHKRVQKVNQNLEDKLLQMADKCTSDKSQLARDIETLSVRLAESNYTIGNLHKENERYKNDMNLAIQLLQCKPDNFVSQKFDSLPIETQARVSSYIMSRAKGNQDSIHSSTGLVNNKSNPNTPEKVNAEEFEFNISASLMSKILEESVQNTISKHCDTCTCLKKSTNPFSFGETRFSISTQTNFKQEMYCTNCNSDILSVQSILSASCSSPQPTKLLNEPQESKTILEKIDSSPPLFLTKPPSINEIIPCEVNTPQKEEMIVDSKNSTKTTDDPSKIVNLKHKEIMEKIGDNLKEMNSKNEFKLPPLEPTTGHHRLCDRTKQAHKSDTDYTYSKPEDNSKGITIEICKPAPQSPNLVSTIKMADDLDISFAQIESPILIPNLSETKTGDVPKTKADLNSVDHTKTLYNSSISSNDAESKTSSSRSWKNNGSYNGSTSKVHIGPGPRFCSLRMQAGSKNILLDNAQPNIAPVLYTRQSRNYDTSPLSSGPLIDDIPAADKKDNSNLFHNQSTLTVLTHNKVFSNASTSEEIPILDLPNEELPLSKPIEICEKPESGYKSNESAEIIDKLLFGMDNIQEGIKQIDVIIHDDKLQQIKKNDNNDKLNTLDTNKDKNLNVVKKNDSEPNSKPEVFKRERRESIHNMKVFNFDSYEKNLKNQQIGKMLPGHKLTAPHFINYGNTKLPGGAQLVMADKKDATRDALNSNIDRKVPVENVAEIVAEINKKFMRTIANQTLPAFENMPDNANAGERNGPNEVSVEKSWSSLSSDDSAAVLQKQQLMRVAEWVQKNLEMEQRTDSDGGHLEELHHVRNDFPRPAKVEHRPRRARQSHHGTSRQHAMTTSVSMVMGHRGASEETEEREEETHSREVREREYTTRRYSREELARMEYNVKQFLLNGTRWTSGPVMTASSPTLARTSSKTETDL